LVHGSFTLRGARVSELIRSRQPDMDVGLGMGVFVWVWWRGC
jgi:hypothetical protein